MPALPSLRNEISGAAPAVKEREKMSFPSCAPILEKLVSRKRKKGSNAGFGFFGFQIGKADLSVTWTFAGFLVTSLISRKSRVIISICSEGQVVSDHPLRRCLFSFLTSALFATIMKSPFLLPSSLRIKTPSIPGKQLIPVTWA